jgi:hypothetical protein
MVVNGNKISVPGIDYKFLLQKGNKVSLQQTSLENGQRYFYEGSFTVLEDDAQRIKLQCKVSDGSGSSPTYILNIEKSSLIGMCQGSEFEPEFAISRNDDSNQTQPSSPTSADLSTAQQEQQENADGIYSYKDESISLQITISGNTWLGKTVIITGMGSENDDVTYESGIVKGNTLYESSGYVEIGNVSGRSLTTSISNSRVTLTKN